MEKYKVVGYEHRAGNNKKSGKPYDMDIFYVVNENPISSEFGYGNRVESVFYNRLVAGELEVVPLLGDVVEFCYNRSGFVMDIRKV